jgi:hypothetical protein
MPAKREQFNDFPPGPRGGPESRDWKLWQSDLSPGQRPPVPQGESGQCCVYNHTGERFLSVDVEAADFTQSGLETRLQTLSPAAGKALWLVPFRGVSPTSVRMPLDLIYLDRDCVVIEAVESFPIFRVSTSSRPAASVLVVPAKSIATTGTRAGDQLIFRSPAEMKLLLEQMAKMKAENEQARAEAQNSGHGSGQVLPWKDVSRSEPLQPAFATTIAPSELVVDPPAQPTPEIAAQPSAEIPALPALEPPVQPAPQNEEPWRKKRSWLERFLSTEPDDKRTALRESIPGLTAFFFTGGAPAPHGIRDVSETGMFVLTEDRWYPGTVIRITLTDQREPTAERSFTVNAVVMRWGNDGVGLHFIFQDKKDRRRRNLSAEDRTMGIADATTFRQYLATLKGVK